MKIIFALLICCIPFILSISESKQQDYGLLQPFYCVLDGKTYFIAYDGDEKFDWKHFEDGKKYGIDTDEPRRILPVEYEKIYNPNMTLLDCFEIKRDGKVGMFNYKTGEILQPRFDYIMPSGLNATRMAYGFIDGSFYEIDASNLNELNRVDFDLRIALGELDFDVLKPGGDFFRHTYGYQFEDNPEGVDPTAVVIMPSWLEVLSLAEKTVFFDLIPDEKMKEKYQGVHKASIVSSEKKSITDKLFSFIMDVFEEGVGIRGKYDNNQEKLVVLNKENNSISTATLTQTEYNPDRFCGLDTYRAITNHLLEVETKQYDHSRESSLRYESMETVFRYWIIKDDGEVELFKSNRYYDFTKVLKIDTRHLGGCFIRSNPDYDMNSEDHSNKLFHIKTGHLSIDDLDLMRNEIFADYGYRFKSEKWQNYFAKKPWYKPRYDDVNDQLTEIDKANIQFILKIKKQMIGNEEKYTRPKKANYSWAG